MTFWNVDVLRDRLVAGTVTSAEQARYYFGSVVLQLLIGRASLLAAAFRWEAVIGVALSVAIAAWGVHRCYRANSAGDNRDFLTRVLCLAFPLTMRMYALWLVIALVLYVVTGYPGHAPDDLSTGALWRFVTWLIHLGLSGWFYHRLSAHLATASQGLR